MGDQTDDMTSDDSLDWAAVRAARKRRTAHGLPVDGELKEIIDGWHKSQALNEARNRFIELGDDPYADGEILLFGKTFENSSKTYEYVAIRRNGMWFTTSTHQRAPMSWDDFKLFLVSGIPAGPLLSLVPYENELQAEEAGIVELNIHDTYQQD